MSKWIAELTGDADDMKRATMLLKKITQMNDLIDDLCTELGSDEVTSLIDKMITSNGETS